jgi:hypothetical protein
VEPFLNNDGVMAEVSYKRTKDTIHANAVQKPIHSQGPNRLLGCRPPAVAESERFLPHAFQTTLNQMRSDFRSAQKSYQYFINKALDNICPGCQSASQTVTHLFSCPAHPTSLRPINIWNNLVAVASFIATLPVFGFWLDPVRLPLLLLNLHLSHKAPCCGYSNLLRLATTTTTTTTML